MRTPTSDLLSEIEDCFVDLLELDQDEVQGTIEHLSYLISLLDLPFDAIDEGYGKWSIVLNTDGFFSKDLSKVLKELDLSYTQKPYEIDLSYKDLIELFTNYTKRKKI